MPDLLRNADKYAKVKPERLAPQTDLAIQAITAGWKKHLEIDRHFHSSAFFKEHANQLRLLLAPIFEGSPIKPFFLGHIALELILDNLLLTTNIIYADDFYDHLRNASHTDISSFLLLNGVDPQKFIKFYTSFINEKYLNSYVDIESVVFALKGVCLRIWKNPFTKIQQGAVCEVVNCYSLHLKLTFMAVFDEMDFLLRDTSFTDTISKF